MARPRFEDARDRLREATQGLSASCVRRPILTIVLNLLIVVAGLAALSDIDVREIPDVDRPIVSVRASYEGATPETVDTQVTSILEDAAARVPGVTTIRSTSESGASRVVVEFDQSVDLNVATNDLRDAIGNIERDLPDEIEDVGIVKGDESAEAIVRLAVTGRLMPIEELTRIIQDTIVDRLASVPGVASVTIDGQREPLVRVLVNPTAIASRGLDLADLEAALDTVGMDMPAGNLAALNQTMLVRADGSVKTAEDVEAIYINGTTQVGDIAEVIFGPAEKVGVLRINGQAGVGLGILRQARSNTLAVSQGVEEAVAQLNSMLPESVSIRVISDDSNFIRGALNSVLHALLQATLIVIAIMFLFLRSFRLIVIPAVTVPIALIGTLAAMWVAGFTINILTLLAFVLATGLVVDDAIVVLENIERHRRQGMGPRAAAVLGTRQVFFAVVSTTLTLAAVFVPISFFPGQVGKLFAEFGFVMAFSVLISAFVALTLCPMLASRLLSEESLRQPTNALTLKVAHFGSAAERTYHRLLGVALGAPRKVVATALLLAGLASIPYFLLPEELVPEEDRGVISLAVIGPQGVNENYINGQLQLVEAALQPVFESGEATNLYAISGRGGGASGFVMVTLLPWAERDRSQQEILDEVMPRLREIPGVRIAVREGNSLGIDGGGSGVEFAVTGVDYDAIAAAANELMVAAQQSDLFEEVELEYNTTQPQLSIQIDRERASDLGVKLDGLAMALGTLVDGREMGELNVGGEVIPVRVEAPEGAIDDPRDLEGVYVRTAGGRMVPLSSFVSMTERAVAPELPRFAQQRALPIDASLARGYSLREGMNEIDRLAARILPPGMAVAYQGDAAALDETSHGIALTFGFALLIVLMVLAAQFESFVSASIIMFTVPFGLAAAILAIAVTGGSINIYSQIGLVMLVGIMAKNGILIVEFASQLRNRGYSVGNAVREACRIRLRPVVMTMVATVMGGVPLVLSSGAGAEAQHALGWIVVGGLGLATLVTLFVTPVAFLLFAGMSRARSEETERLDFELEEALVSGGDRIEAGKPPRTPSDSPPNEGGGAEAPPKRPWPKLAGAAR